MLFLVNAGGKMAKRKRHRRSRKPRARAPRKRRMPAALRAYWAAKRKGGTVARRRGRRHRSNPTRRHHRRRYRRNPGVSSLGRGFVGAAMKGAKCGAFVTLGEALSVALPGIIKLPTAGMLGLAVRGLVGTGLGVFGRSLFGSEHASYVVAGAWGGVWRQLVRQFNVPLLAPALAGYPGPIQLRGYSDTARAAVTGVPTGQTRTHEASGTLF